MIFYTADLHLGYFPILHDTARPFAGVPEMDEALIANWNARVGADDSVYIVGDFSYNGGEAPVQYLARLNGHLHLIRGNHDTGLNHAERLLDYCDSVTDFLEIDDGDMHIILCHYPILHEKGGYIVISSRLAFSLTPMERMGVEQFGMAFRVMIQHQRMLAELEYRYREEFTCDLLFGKIEGEQSARSRARALDWEMSFPMSIFLIDVKTNDKVYNKVDVLHALQERALPELVRGHNGNAVFLSTTGKYIVVFLDMPGADCPEKAIKVIDGVLKGLQIGYAAGISRPATQMQQIPKAYQESKDAMYIARLTGANRVLYFRDIGLYRVLHAARDPKDLQEFCQDTLGPLMRYDAQNNAELMATLDMILTCGGNLKETARRMFVHYNTIRYRQRLIEEQLDKDLTNLDDYQTLNLAMKIHHMWP